ncbi:MAG TPA: alkaline phosphatase family protein [Desulfomonilaceae bacterium]|nr:alkaline phosphatase family protein [Desulfomonilaceae bacterium]
MDREHIATGKHPVTKKQIGRRSFIKRMAALLGGMTSMNWGSLPTRSLGSVVNNQEKLIFIAIDALNPKYFQLDAKGLPGGSEGNWLMPNVHAFLKRSMWYRNAKCYLPAATDMNHLNALAGTSSGQTGIISVWAQPSRWNESGEVVIQPTSMSFAKDDKGRPVDTLFHAWKRRWPNSKTLLITGKAWVGEMFRDNPAGSGIDILVTGVNHPDYLKDPEGGSFAHPATDKNAACDPASTNLGFWGGPMRLSEVMTRLYTGQGSLLTWQMEHFPNHFPQDRWIVDSTLEIFRRENPDVAYIIMAQCDDAGHCIGSAWDSSEFVDAVPPYKPPVGCENKPEYQLVSGRNKLLFKEAALNVIRDVDIQFGRLIDGLGKQGVLGRSRIILLSDHGSENHLYTEDFLSTDCKSILENAGIVEKGGILEKQTMYAFSVSSYGALYWRRAHKDRVSGAKAALLAHRALNPQTGTMECPWWVLDRDDMKNGVEGLCLPGELYHNYYVDIDKEKTLIWPDLIILAKNGWQIPVYNGQIPNVGRKVPTWWPPWRVYNGGHGSVDTLPIVAAVMVPGGKTGVSDRPIRIADLGITAAALFGLELKSTTIGEDLSKDLV